MYKPLSAHLSLRPMREEDAVDRGDGLRYGRPRHSESQPLQLDGAHDVGRERRAKREAQCLHVKGGQIGGCGGG